MRSWIAFMKKEWLGQLRTGKAMVLLILFVLFGIMNPAIAKLTPWLLEMMADSLAESGMVITGITVTAMDSWVQFYKNIPMALIAFVLLEGSIFTQEYQSGTLVLSLTKGLRRSQVIFSKALVLMLLWTGLYWLCYGITWSYNAYFWDNSLAQNLGFSALVWWIFGLWIIALLVFFSTLLRTNGGVLLSIGGVVAALGLVSLIPKATKYLPTLLTDGNALIYGTAAVADYGYALAIALGMIPICIATSIPCLNQKQL